MDKIASDYEYIPTPFGARLLHGFDRLRALTDEELCAEMNGAAYVDPAALKVATSRDNVVNYHNGRAYVWSTMAEWKEWKAQQPDFFSVLLAFVQKSSAEQTNQ